MKKFYLHFFKKSKKKIKKIQKHIKNNTKDHSSKRGLLKIINTNKRMDLYLKNKK
ncbi:30S ribosomal protein S15 [Candidatus Vidania fulgoroideorum]